MPDMDSLMAAWPPRVEDALDHGQLPPASIPLSTLEYARLVCALCDIPVHASEGTIPSLHVLFSLFAEFRQNQHFGHLDGGQASMTP